jgi:hypothetical protein
MNTPYRSLNAIMSDEALEKLGAPEMVYIRTVTVGALRDSIDGLDSLPDDHMLYAVHAADGACMAVMEDLETAYVTAREHEMEPVRVH